MFKSKIILASLMIFLAVFSYAAPPSSEITRWVSLTSDARDKVREIIRLEVEKREGFSTANEEKSNLKAVEDEKDREDSAYKRAIINANKEFIRAKKKRDDINSQFQAASSEYDEFGKNVKTIRVGIENLDNQINLYEQDIKTQRSSLKRWLQTEKQGEILVAVIYTRGFKDRAHELENAADRASAPLIAQRMGTYIQSFSKVINNVLTVDFIRAIEEGTAKWNNEEPLRIELDKNNRGTTYLRLKRYELYPFQDNKAGRVKKSAAVTNYKVAIINSRKELETFLKQHQYVPDNYALGRADTLIKDTHQSNAAAEEALNEQVKSFQDRISTLQNKIGNARGEKDAQKMLLKRKEESYGKLRLDVANIRGKKDIAENDFHAAQITLQEKKKSHESIIVKTALATTKGSQTPAEASAEAIIDKLAEVKNDARTQHSSSTTEVTNFKVSAESSTQAITEARIIGVRLISFINEGDSVRVNMAFRVRTVLDEQPDAADTQAKSAPLPVQEPEERETKADSTPDSKPAAAPQPDAEKKRVVPSTIKRNYRILATQEAQNCIFDITSVLVQGEVVKVVVVVINNETEESKVKTVALYDERFGNWPKSKIFDDTGKRHDVSQVFIIQENNKRIPLADSGRSGPELQPQTSLTMELIFKNIPITVKTAKLNLHPFISYKRMFGWTWQEYDLPIANIRLRR